MFIAALVVLLFAPLSAAQAQVFGLSALLDPEGSRLFPQSFVAPRHPGKPDPRWRSFDWRFTDVSAGPTKYRLYFYKEEDWTARFVLPRIQGEIESLRTTFNFNPPTRFSYLLFTSLRDFRQANIFFISEGVEGITSTTEATMAIPYWGDPAAFDHVSKHELVHQFQVQKLMSGELRGREAGASTPLWFIEGMAEYYSQNGVDPESRMYIRDLLLNPDKKRNYVMSDFFDEGGFDFVHTYKAGQAKNDFLETEFGKGTIQKLLNRSSGIEGESPQLFKDLATAELKVKPEELQNRWMKYLDGYKKEAEKLKPMDDSSIVKAVGDTLDYFRISPDGKLLAIREVDPVSGTSSIQLMNFTDPQHPSDRTEVAHDNQPNIISLFFFQNPTVTLSDHMIAYVVETTSGPEIEMRDIKRAKEDFSLRGPRRLELHRNGLIQITSIALSPDEKTLALIGLSSKGWTNVYVIENLTERPLKMRALTDEAYHWEALAWSPDGKEIVASSDRTSNGKHALFRIGAQTGAKEQLTFPLADQSYPSSNDHGLVFQSWESGSLQIHQLSFGSGSPSTGPTQAKLTDVNTGIRYPQIRDKTLYAVAFKSGRFRLVSLPVKPEPETFTSAAPSREPSPWTISTAELPESQVQKYRAFRGSSTRMDGLFAYFASGSVLGIGASVSDLMRDYSISGEFSMMGSIKYTNGYVFFSNYRGRTKWTVGPYAILQPRLDNIFPTNTSVRTYLNREYGALGALQYPLGIFSYMDLELRGASVNRSDFSDASLAAQWDARNPGSEFMLSPIVRLGYDSILYEAYTGPLKGWGLLAESDTSVFPHRGELNERVRLDAANYMSLAGTMVLALQGMAGWSWGGDYRNSFLISSDDILRGYPFFDDRLYGNYLLAGKTELRFPIGTLFGFPPLRGVAAYDLGSIFTAPGQMGVNVESSYSGGLSLNIPPLSISFLVSSPTRVAPGPKDSTVSHFTLRYLYL